MAAPEYHQQSVRFSKIVQDAINSFREQDHRPTFQNAMEGLILKGFAAFKAEKESQNVHQR